MRRKVVFKVRLIFTILVSVAWCTHSQTNSNKPNIVFILCDDLGYGEIQGLASTSNVATTSIIPTPFVNTLIEEGMVFTDAHSGSSVCTPTRYGIMTGRYSWRTSLQSGVVQGFDNNLVAENRPTIGNFLGDQGYDTALIGKWHLNFRYVNPQTGLDYTEDEVEDGLPPVGTTIPDGPRDRGFDYYHGFHHAKDMKAVIQDREVILHEDEINMLPRLTTKSKEYIEGRVGETNPFFLYVPLGSPHTPIVPSAEWQGKSGLGDYADFVMQTDATVGVILKALEDNGFDNNTLVVFSSDNGTSIKAKPDNLAAAGHIVSGGYRGIKSDLWDGGHRVPFIVKYPGTVTPGSISHETICLTDMYATFSELINTPLPSKAGEDSVSFLPALSGNAITTTRVGVVHHGASGHFGYRLGDYKLLLAKGSAGLSSPKENEVSSNEPLVQLYNMATDPAETTNIYETNPEIATQLFEQLAADVNNGRSTTGEVSQNDTSDIVLFKTTEDPFLSGSLDKFILTVDETQTTERFVFGDGTGNHQVDLVQGTGSTFTEDNVSYKNSYVNLLGETKGVSEIDAGGIRFYLQANSGETLMKELQVSLRKREGNSVAGTITVNGISSSFSGTSDGSTSTSFEDLDVTYNKMVTITDTPILVQIDFSTLDASDAPTLKAQVRIEHIDIADTGSFLSIEKMNGAGNIQVFPNPVIDKLSITRSNVAISKIQIISVTGGKILEFVWDDASLTKELNVANLKNGIYFVNLSNGRNYHSIKKIIVAK